MQHAYVYIRARARVCHICEVIMITIKMRIIKDDNNGNNNKCNDIDIIIRIIVTIVYIVRKDRLLSDFLRHNRTARRVAHFPVRNDGWKDVESMSNRRKMRRIDIDSTSFRPSFLTGLELNAKHRFASLWKKKKETKKRRKKEKEMSILPLFDAHIIPLWSNTIQNKYKISK